MSLVNVTCVITKAAAFLNEDITFRAGVTDATPNTSYAVITIPAGQTSGTVNIPRQLLPTTFLNIDYWDGNAWVAIPQTTSGVTDPLADLDPSKDYGIAFHGYRINVT